MTIALHTVPDTFLPSTGDPLAPSKPVAGGANAGEIANQTAKGITLWVVGLVPGAGGLAGAILGPLMDAWWPNGGEDAWKAVKDDVERIVDEKIDNLYSKLVQNKLKGLKDLSAEYTKAAKNATTSQSKATAREEWRRVRGHILANRQDFMDSDYDWKVLPYFVTLANMHALLLQELIRNEKALEWDKEKTDSYDPVDDAKKQLKELLDPPTEWSRDGTGGGTYTQHVKKAYEKGIEESAKNGYHKGYDYQRTMLRMALDYARELWPLLKEPGTQWPDQLPYDRETWLGPFGDSFGEKWDTWHAENRYYPGSRSGHMCALRMWSYFPDSDNSWLNTFQRKMTDTGWGDVEGVGRKDYQEFQWEEPPDKVTAFGKVKDSLSGFGLYHGSDRIFYWSNRYHGGSEQRYVEYGIEDFWISDVRNLNPYVDDKDWEDSARAVVIGMRSNKPWRPKKPTPRSGHFYRFTSPDTGRVLAPRQYTLAPDTAVHAARSDGATSQEWQLQAAGEHLWKLVNRYSGQFLLRRDGHCVQGDHPEAHPEQALWRLREPDPYTWTLCSPDGTEGLDGAGRLRTEASAIARWFAVPVPDTDTPSVLRVDQVGCDTDNRARLTLTNPSAHATVHDWTLSFHLPADGGTDPRLTAHDGLVLRSATTDDRGLLIRLQPDGSGRDLAPGETRTFTLVLTPPDDETPSALIPSDAHLEGETRRP
ncbi:insecticidal delta-endotoxin Cry8Ea1 family protein [Streptomyces somaliensis]|uniref:insecticidal delta-endotoxin Cry8Ea1 family protein n=1 Tax=Streptomyces somaliensis TaxID=78355 RepID=UPI0020CBA265|nr:insecticidal delta-endotoxin Cry8Ea1 family protein [Streptomyces somaliensis]MCP9946826.1 insecticidal delta-endotoxin Cry8Ea1 family protein [Streptomyces somaliensis]MCP9963465.1 insecticidal delta-endotoxin Cry8Ea1 family protein [Streptomyces somaliensis]